MKALTLILAVCSLAVLIEMCIPRQHPLSQIRRAQIRAAYAAERRRGSSTIWQSKVFAEWSGVPARLAAFDLACGWPVRLVEVPA